MRKIGNRSLVFAAAVAAVFPGALAQADTLNGGGGSFQPATSWSQSQLVDSTAPTPGTPYWNNSSGDGPRGNVGWCLTGGSSVCTMTGSPGTTLPYYGTAVSGSVGNMFFTSSGTPLALTIAGIHTDETIAQSYDVFGYYVVPTSGSPTLVPLFSTQPGATQLSLGSMATLDLASGTNYGFYLENIRGGGGPFQTNYTFYMDSTLNSVILPGGGTPPFGPDSLQHFAIFQSTNGYIIGDVDGNACTGNPVCLSPTEFDYQDLIVTTVATPEPATVGLTVTSLLFLAGFAYRRRRSA